MQYRPVNRRSGTPARSLLHMFALLFLICAPWRGFMAKSRSSTPTQPDTLCATNGPIVYPDTSPSKHHAPSDSRNSNNVSYSQIWLHHCSLLATPALYSRNAPAACVSFCWLPARCSPPLVVRMLAADYVLMPTPPANGISYLLAPCSTFPCIGSIATTLFFSVS